LLNSSFLFSSIIIIILKKLTELVNIQKPFFTICRKPLVEQINLWKNKIPRVQPHYAVKCNNDPYLINILNEHNVNFDCASGGEIQQILNSNISSTKIIYANPYKNINDLDYAVKENVPITVVDSLEELDKLRNKKIETMVRVKVNDKDSLMPFSSKFGASFEESMDILKKAKEYKMNISGFSFHVGSGCFNSNQYYDAVKMVSDIMIKSNYLNHEYKIIDIGGGFAGDCDEKFLDQAKKINEAVDMFKNGFHPYKDITFISEPGRFYMTKTHTLYVPIIAKRKTNNKTFYIIDESVYSSFSNIKYDMANPKFEIVNESRKTGKEYDSVIFGRTCDSGDKIQELKLPELEIGDYFEIKNMGAYTTASSTNFNGFKSTEKVYLC